MSIHIKVQAEAFDPAEESRLVHAGDSGVGAVVTFLGLMRDINEGDSVSGMTLEHYPGMTERALHTIADEAMQRWELGAINVVHRVGDLDPEDPIVLVAVSSRHRGNAFRACEFIIDYLKNRAPFWKKERTAAGDRWVEARSSDQDAEARWQSGHEKD